MTTSTPTLQEKARRLRTLHDESWILVLVNVWDAASARAVAAVPGCDAIATASHSVAAAHGDQDGEHMPFELALVAIARIAEAVKSPVTADLEGGYGDMARARAAIRAGAVGGNLEDAMRPVDQAVRAVRAAVAASRDEGLPFVLNARADAYLHRPARDHPRRRRRTRHRPAHARRVADPRCRTGLLRSVPPALGARRPHQQIRDAARRSARQTGQRRPPTSVTADPRHRAMSPHRPHPSEGTPAAMTIDLNTPDRSATASDTSLRQARSSAAFWTAVGHARGHTVIRRRGFLAVAGDERAGLRILAQEPDLGREELAELTDLAGRASGPIDAEDPFSATDLSRLDMNGRQMPIMLRAPGAVAEPAMQVIRLRTEEDLRAAEQVVIAAFTLSRFEPYRAGEMFPEALIHQPGVDVFLARLDGEVAGACVTTVKDGFGSHYWVGTAPAFRSRGVGRAIMLGSLAPITGLPVTLTASRLGRPLYESLGFQVTATSTWWSSR